VLRFIEYMDVGASNGWNMGEVLPSAEVAARIDRAAPLASVARAYAGETAQRWRYVDGGGEIGLISSVTGAFCGDCTRARLSTDGKLYLCLFASRGYDLQAMLRGGASDAQIEAGIATIWAHRADRYSEMRGGDSSAEPRIEMSYIGG
jgi:cyclic pyranopterin phosphate synthase